MPEFTVEEWTSFKEQFISVIRFIMYCFDLCFDTFRSNPLLYAAFFFPVFAVAFFVIFDLVTGVSPFAAIIHGSRGAEGKGFIHGYSGVSGKHGNIKSQNLAVRSMQQRSEGSIKAVNSSSSLNKAAAGKSGSSGTSTNLSGNSNSTIGYGKAHTGVDLNSKKHQRVRAATFVIAKGLFSKDETTGTYSSKSKSSGSKNYVYNYSVSTGHSELDIDAD